MVKICTCGTYKDAKILKEEIAKIEKIKEMAMEIFLYFPIDYDIGYHPS